MIVFRKKNDVYLEVVEGDKGELMMLSDYFTFEVPGAKFTPAYKNKIWDGKIRLFSLRDKTIYLGLAQELIKFSKDFDVDVYFDAKKHEIPGLEQDIDDVFVDGFIKALNPHSKGLPIEIRDYQIDAFKYAIRNQRAIVLSPTASGKSLIIYTLMRWWREVQERKILIIVPSVSLVAQLISDFSDYSNGNFTDVVGITAGVSKNHKQRVVVSTWQSIHKMPASWFAQFGAVCVDEVHHAQSKSIQSIMNKLLVCPDRVGFTGTLSEAKTHELVLKGLFGPVKRVISTKELMDRDQVAQLKVEVLQLKFNDAERKLVRSMDYQQEVDFIINHDRRNKFIARLASSLPGNTLVIFSRIDHGKHLYSLIETQKEKHYVAGETDKEQREMTRQFAEKNDVIIIASLGVFSTGVNIKNLHNLIFAHPTKSKIKVLQSIGRILRKTEDGKPSKVYDIVDDLKHKERENYSLKHADERMKQYILERFEYNFRSFTL